MSMKIRLLTVLAHASLSLCSLPAIATEDAAETDRHLCSICHGYGGTTSSELFPQLAGQPAPYLEAQLKAFRDKTRADENARRFMWGLAARMTDDEIRRLAAFYAAQAPLHQGKIRNRKLYEQGQSIFRTGMTDKGVPACMSCHGEKGEGHNNIPRLGGQNETYLARQLKVFFGNERPAAVAMHEIVKNLSKNDIAAIAQYLQAQ